MRRIGLTLLVLGLTLALSAPASAYQAFKGPLGVLQNKLDATEGYVLIAPQNCKTTYLMDKDGNVVHEWVSKYDAFYAELLPNGNLARHSRLPEAGPNFGGAAGLIEEFNWDGEVVWSYQVYEEGVRVGHHTFEVMPNGNYMILVWEYKSYEDALAKGMDPDYGGRCLFKDGFRMGKNMVKGIWPDYIMEVNHDKKVVWEWHVWDHIGTGYNQIDINRFNPPEHNRAYAGPDWTHFNGVSYNPKTNKVAVTSRNLSEVYVIDYATGELEYRWGNPYNYGQGRRPSNQGDNGDQKLFGPHAPDWTVEGNITILDNGNQRPNSVGTGFVELDYKNDKVVFEWYANKLRTMDRSAARSNFYSAYQSGVNKMPNGNYLITATTGAHILEISGKDGSLLWEFVSPWSKDKIYKTSSGHGQNGGGIHRAMFYAPDFVGFKGKDLSTVLYSVPNWVVQLNQNPVPRHWVPLTPLLPGRY